MNEERITGSALQDEVLLGQVMKTPDDVAAMLRLKVCGWGIKRIARELGCSHHTVKHYVTAGGAVPFNSPKRVKLLDGHEDWLRERFIRHRGNADVVRQDLAASKGLAVSRRTLQRAVQPYRQALKAEVLATVRFETAPGQQLQIDFGERLVEIAGGRVKAFVFVATLGYSRRVHVRAFRNEKQEHWFAGRRTPSPGTASRAGRRSRRILPGGSARLRTCGCTARQGRHQWRASSVTRCIG